MVAAGEIQEYQGGVLITCGKGVEGHPIEKFGIDYPHSIRGGGLDIIHYLGDVCCRKGGILQKESALT